VKYLSRSKYHNLTNFFTLNKDLEYLILIL